MMTFFRKPHPPLTYWTSPLTTGVSSITGVSGTLNSFMVAGCSTVKSSSCSANADSTIKSMPPVYPCDPFTRQISVSLLKTELNTSTLNTLHKLRKYLDIKLRYKMINECDSQSNYIGVWVDKFTIYDNFELLYMLVLQAKLCNCSGTSLFTSASVCEACVDGAAML